MYVLFETPAGFALLKVLKDSKLEKVDSLHKYFKDGESAEKIVQLRAFKKFKDTKEAMKCVEKLLKGKMSKTLEKFLQKNIIDKEIQEELMISDKKLAKTVTEKLGIQVQTGKQVDELMRCIRFQMESLITGIEEKELK
jgi:nucleolar protein 58